MPVSGRKQTRTFNIDQSIIHRIYHQQSRGGSCSNKPIHQIKLAPWISLLWMLGFTIRAIDNVGRCVKFCSEAKHNEHFISHIELKSSL